MRDKIVGLLEKIDMAVAESVGVVSEPELEPVARLRNQIKQRLAYPEDVLVVGLVGGTGSGKSSIFNAVAGAEVTQTGGMRPTTSDPAALVPSTRKGALSGFLDDLGIVRRIFHDRAQWLCLLDMPDTDSVRADHRHLVEALLPRVDVVIWVMDPEKYRDEAIHSKIAELATHQGQFLFILNQVDRVPDGDLSSILDDLRRALIDDGIAGGQVLAIAADPAFGPPEGVVEMLETLGEFREDPDFVYEKLMVDLGSAVSGLLSATGGAAAVDFESRWESTLDHVAALARSGATAEAGHGVARFLDELAAELGGEVGRELRLLAAKAPLVVDRALREVGDLEVSIRRSLNVEIAIPVRGLLKARARCHAAIADLALELAAAASGSS